MTLDLQCECEHSFIVTTLADPYNLYVMMNSTFSSQFGDEIASNALLIPSQRSSLHGIESSQDRE